MDESFEKTFQLLEQLSADTEELKNAEAQRKERLDAALSEVENVIGRMKLANEEREQEAKRNARELGELRDLIPKAIEKEKQAQEERLKELGTEMKSLKTLVQNRMRDGVGSTPLRPSTPSYSSSQQQPPSQNGQVLGNGTPVQQSDDIPSSSSSSPPAAENRGNSSPYTAPASTSSSSTTTTNSNPYQSRLLGNSAGKAAIPAWQLAAKKKSEDAKAAAAASNSTTTTTTPTSGTPATSNVKESGTVQDAVDGSSA